MPKFASQNLTNGATTYLGIWDLLCGVSGSSADKPPQMNDRVNEGDARGAFLPDMCWRHCDAPHWKDVESFIPYWKRIEMLDRNATSKTIGTFCTLITQPINCVQNHPREISMNCLRVCNPKFRELRRKKDRRSMNSAHIPFAIFPIWLVKEFLFRGVKESLTTASCPRDI